LPTTNSAPLRELAKSRRLPIGTCVDMAALASESAYGDTIRREFDMVVAENAFKAHMVWRGPREYDFADTDRLAQFARDNGMILRGHTLVWHQAVPKWLSEGSFTTGNVSDLLRDYIHAIAGRYKGAITAWDVVNEAITDGESPGYREDSFWFKAIGPDYVKLAFAWAHEADPDARLYYNDYESEDTRPKGNAVFAMVKELKSAGVPIHGVGLQCHFINGWRATDGHRDNVRRIAELGLDWQVTEADIRMQLDGKPATVEQLAEQAAGYRDLVDLCLTEAGCTGFLTWGLTDAHSWIPGFRKGWGAALLLDEQYQPKPAYDAIAEALRGG
jgi:endo-1,4-beta-xylanase